MGTDDEESERERILMMQMAEIERQNQLVEEANAARSASFTQDDDEEGMKAIQQAEEAARLEAEEQAKKEAEEQAMMETILKAANEAEAARLAAEKKMEAEREAAAREEEEAARKLEAARLAEEQRQNEEEEEKSRLEAEKAARLEQERLAEEQRLKEEEEEKSRLAAEEAARLEQERLAEEQRQMEEEEEKSRLTAEEATRLEQERLAEEQRQMEEAEAARKAKEEAVKKAEEEANRIMAEEEANRIAEEEAATAKIEEDERLAEEEAKRAEQEVLELESRLAAEGQIAAEMDVDSDAEDMPSNQGMVEDEDDTGEKLAEEMRREMERMGQDDDDGDDEVPDNKDYYKSEEEEMEIDFSASGGDLSTPPTSSTNINGKVSIMKGSIEEKTKNKPFIIPEVGKLTPKETSPSVRSKEVRVTPPFFPKSKAAKSSDMKNPSTRPTGNPGKLQVNTMASPAPLPRVAMLSSPSRGNTGRSTLSKPRTESSQAKSPVPLPRVAMLSSPVRGLSPPPPSRRPPKSPGSLFGMPRSQAYIPKPSTMPRVLSPRDGPRCPTGYDPELHGSKGPCERCFMLSSVDEQEKFQITGHHLRIMIVSGGCDRSCLIFPRDESQPPVRLCKKCYFDTHRTFYDSYTLVPSPVER